VGHLWVPKISSGLALVPAPVGLRRTDRLIFVWLYRLFPSLLEAAVIFKPETLVRLHRGGFRFFWRWKSRRGPFACWSVK